MPVATSRRRTIPTDAALMPRRDIHASTTGLWVFGNSWQNLMSGHQLSFGNTSTTAAHVFGVDWRGSFLGHTHVNDFTRLAYPAFGVLPTVAATVVFGYEKRDSTNRDCTALGLNFSGFDVLLFPGARFNIHLPWMDGTVYWQFGGATEDSTMESVAGLTVTDYHVWVFTTGPRGMEIWQDGNLRSSNSASPTRTVNTPEQNAFCYGLGISNSPSDLANAHFLSVHTDQMPRSWIIDVSADPYGMLVESYPRRRYFTPAVAPPAVTAFPWLYYAQQRQA